MKEIVVTPKYNGKKLNTFLLDTFDGLSLNVLYKTLRKKDIRINDTKISENVIIHTGDKIKVFLSDEQLYKQNFKIDIVYEDENIVIVNKPAGIEVTGNHSLTSYLQQFYAKKLSSNITYEFEKESFSKNITASEKEKIIIAPCHRLDRNTTGLTLFAKNDTALSILLEKFKSHEIEKHYRAMVVGIPTKKQADLTAYLFKDTKKSLVYISDTYKKGYEEIRTSYNVLSFNKKQNTSILDITLHTGKTHQIRAHLAHIGFPIVGDGKYGNGKINKKLGYKVQQLCSFSLKFCFKTDSELLNYLNEKEINLK